MYFIVKNPFKNSSLEQVLTAMSEHPYFYDKTVLIGAVTSLGTSVSTYHEVFDKRDRHQKGIHCRCSEIDGLDIPIAFATFSQGWFVGRTTMWNCCGFETGACEFSKGLSDEEYMATGWKQNVLQSFDALAADLEDTYYDITIPDAPIATATGNLYILNADVPMSGGGVGNNIPRMLLVNHDTPAEDTLPMHVYRTTYYPNPFIMIPTDLIANLWAIGKEYDNVCKAEAAAATAPGVSVIAPDGIRYAISGKDHAVYCEIENLKSPDNTLHFLLEYAPGWIAIEGPPEEAEKFMRYSVKYMAEYMMNGSHPFTRAATEATYARRVYSKDRWAIVSYIPANVEFYTEKMYVVHAGHGTPELDDRATDDE